MAVGLNNPIDHPEVWDRVVVAGVASPGYCKIKQHARKNEWDIKRGKGAKGATITYVQRPPMQFTIEFYAGYYDISGAGGPSDFAAWDAFLPLLQYDPTKKTPQAIDIYHPALADVDLSSVVTESIGGWEDAGDNLFKREIAFLEYFPPPARSAVGGPTGSKSATPGNGPTPNPPPSAPQSAEDILKQLQQQAQAA